MIRTNELKGIIMSKGLTQKDVAKEIGITEQTFYRKMNRGVFGSDEIEAMIKILEINDPMTIFFADSVT